MTTIMSGLSRFERIAMVAAVVSVSMVAVVAFALRGCGDRDVTVVMPVPDSVAAALLQKDEAVRDTVARPVRRQRVRSKKGAVSKEPVGRDYFSPAEDITGK